MSLQGVLHGVENLPPFRRVFSSQERETSLAVVPGLRPLAAAGLAAGRPLLVVTATGREAEDTAEALRAYLGDDGAVAVFPSWETLPHERLSPRTDTVGARLTVLRRLAGDDGWPRAVVAPVRSLLHPLVAGLERLEPVSFTVGEDLGFDDAVRRLSEAAYSRVELVSRRGEFAVRGGLIDVFAPTEKHPARVEFFGDEVESIRWFSVADQRTLPEDSGHPGNLTAVPCRELLLTPEVQSRAAALKDRLPAVADLLDKIAGGVAVEGMESLSPLLAPGMVTLVDHLRPGTLVVEFERERLRHRAQDLVNTNEEFLDAAWDAAAGGADVPVDMGADLGRGAFRELDALRREAVEGGHSWWSFDTLGTVGDDEAGTPGDSVAALPGTEPPAYLGKVEDFAADAAARLRQGWRIVVATDGPGLAQRLSETLRDLEVPAVRTPQVMEEPPAGVATVTTASIGTGFALERERMLVLSERDVLGRGSRHTVKDKARMPARRRNAIDLVQLQPGDYVVHEHHGVGRFVELVKRSVGPRGKQTSREYLVLEYAPSKRGQPGDRLFVPADQLDQVSRYVGGDEPALSKMGGSDWAKAKSKARKAVKEIAGELVRLYSARMASRGHSFAPDTPWQQELEEAFPYVETPDQLTTINEVKADMEREVPMDRLVSGDVGYGKTEIAVRAAFKAVQDGKQVAVLVPTTLLVQQHFETFSERFAGFPVRLAALSRFQTAKESKAVMEGLRDGAVDVVIGTHRLLSKEVGFKDLGLVVIDEEQRFGVEHKEKLKTLRTNVDVLAMSATPIPRTLEMAVTGIREMSTLATPPEERHPVLTYVGPHTDKQVSAAIRRELMREGQVFYVHNRVSSIESVARRITELVPEARVAVAHGQMGEGRLEQIIVDFWEKRFDVLVCTTIIETGLDISNANTLIVDNADRYGLSQLHQLRGRVGRARERAYSYFLYPAEKTLGEVALERLRAVASHNELGSGMQLAMKDLEIRGAGNLLGGEQSGHIAGVGFDMYIRMVGEAVADFRGEERGRAPEMKIDLPVDAVLPDAYVPGERLRLEAYRKLAAAMDDASVDAVLEELRDRYGAPPQEVLNLAAVARLRGFAQRLGVTDIVSQGNFIRFAPLDLPDSKQARAQRLYPGCLYKNDVLLIPKPKTKAIGGEELTGSRILAWARDVLQALLVEDR